MSPPKFTSAMSSFFTTPASQKKRKRQDAPTSSYKKRNTTTATTTQAKPKPKSTKRTTRERSESSISGSESGSDAEATGKRADDESSSASSGAEDETAAERRLKLTERYLENVRADVAGDEGQSIGFDAEDVDRDLISARLKEDAAEEKARLYRHIAAGLDYGKAANSLFRADTLASTGVACCPPFAYTVSKDMTLVKWKLVAPPWTYEGKVGKGVQAPRRKKPKQVAYTKGNKSRGHEKGYQHHVADVLCVAASADGKFVATGGADRRLIVWDAPTLKPLKVFMQHRDAVTGLAFRGKTNQMFSASKDRTIKIWSLNELAYVETLFGHQDEVVDVAAVGGATERCISVGARDRTARLWKVVEESQLVFRGGGGGGSKSAAGTSTDAGGIVPPKTLEGTLDRVVQLDSHLFVTGSDNGALSLYALHKKKPLHIYSLAHGYDPPISVEQSSAELEPQNHKTSGQATPRWITALACVPYSDLFLSGSWDGYVRAWKISDDQKKIESVGVLGRAPASLETATSGDVQMADASSETLQRGVINDLAVFERGERGKDGACVVAAVGSEPRMGRWVGGKRKGWKNGAAVFEIPKAKAGVAIAPDEVASGV